MGLAGLCGGQQHVIEPEHLTGFEREPVDGLLSCSESLAPLAFQ